MVVSGTTGNVSTRGLRFTQRGWLWELKGFSLGAGYQYLKYQARFQFGNSFKIHTRQPSAILEKLPIQETTRSRMRDFDVASRRNWSLPSRGSFSGEVRHSPVVSAFLTTILPAKYPGEEINFFTPSTGLSWRLAPRYLIRAASLEFFTD